MIINDLFNNKKFVAEAIGDLGSKRDQGKSVRKWRKSRGLDEQGGAEGLNEFAPGNGGGESGRWYTDGELADIIGDDWFEDFDVSNDGFNIDAYGEKAKKNLVGYANAWFDDKGYTVNVIGVEHNDVDHDLQWYIVGSFHNPRFANEGVAEDDDAVAAFLARGGEVQKLKPAKPRKGERWQGSAHIGAAGGRGTKGRVSGLAANTGKSGKPVVTAEQGVAEGSLGKVLSFPDLLGQVKHILDAKHESIGWKMSKRDDDVFLFSAMNDYDVRSMLVVAKDRDGWVSATNGIVDPYGEVEMFDKQELPMTLASASEIADEAISTYHDIDLSDYADEDKQGVNEVSLGDYRKKATVNKAMAQTNKFFDRDDPAKVAAADRTIAKRERGLARADVRAKAYTPPAQDAEKMQRDLTAKYPNIDELVADAEQRRDPNYDYAEGDAYYRGREAEQHYQKLKQIQRVIQGLNESLQRTQP